MVASDYFPAVHWSLVEQAIACNIPSHFSATDLSMADLLERCGTDINSIKKKHGCTPDDPKMIRFPFSSSRKRMSTIIQNATGDGSYDRRLHIKGASEMVVACCNKYVDESGNVTNLDDNTREKVKQIITTYAKNALRTIALAYRDLSENECGEKHD